jgi:hypothetical protein
MPIMLLRRLVIDRVSQGRGPPLFRDCAGRVLQAPHTIGIHGIAVYVISEQAEAFYWH